MENLEDKAEALLNTIFRIMMKQKIIKRDSAYLIIYDLNNKRIDSINILGAINKTNYYPKSIKFRNLEIVTGFSNG